MINLTRSYTKSQRRKMKKLEAEKQRAADRKAKKSKFRKEKQLKKRNRYDKKLKKRRGLQDYIRYVREEKDVSYQSYRGRAVCC